MATHSPRDVPLNGALPNPGPHPSYIQIAKPYIFEQQIQQCLASMNVSETKEASVRLQGVTWIDNVRKALLLPVRTYNTAVVYYHKFRLVHPDNEYDFRDAAAAALFNACKIEDTLKKSRDILCAAYNLKLPVAEQLSSDDLLFETHSKTILGLERLMLEASGFDFRNRHPQRILVKLAKMCNLEKDSVASTAFTICLDLYRTFAPLKQSSQTMALACIELAARLHDKDLTGIVPPNSGVDYRRWSTSREEIMETLMDLLELYTQHRNQTSIGPEYLLDTYINIQRTLNQELTSRNYARYTQWRDGASQTEANGTRKMDNRRKVPNGTSSSKSVSPQSPSRIGGVGERGKEGTVRFMLDPERASEEKAIVKEYFRVEEIEEYV